MAPDTSRQGPTETSPLLGKQAQNGPSTGSTLEAAPIEPDIHDDTDVEGDGDEADLERQPSNGESFKHQGLPEVRKRMKYIFPAIAIGVSRPPSPPTVMAICRAD